MDFLIAYNLNPSQGGKACILNIEKHLWHILIFFFQHWLSH